MDLIFKIVKNKLITKRKNFFFFILWSYIKMKRNVSQSISFVDLTNYSVIDFSYKFFLHFSLLSQCVLKEMVIGLESQFEEILKLNGRVAFKRSTNKISYTKFTSKSLYFLLGYNCETEYLLLLLIKNMLIKLLFFFQQLNFI